MSMILSRPGMPSTAQSATCEQPEALKRWTEHTEDDLEMMARTLETAGNYRVLRRLKPRPIRTGLRSVGEPPMRGIVLDTETTGLVHGRDEVVELAMIAFTFDADGIHDVVGSFEGLQQPSSPLSDEVKALTGLTDEMLAGQAIDPAEVRSFVGGADLVVAHNAKFDRRFAEGVAPIFTGVRWACSATEVPWRQLGADGTRLGHLLAAYGTFHSAHRALADCQALLEILDRVAPDGHSSAFRYLLAAAQRTTVEIRAVGAPYERKELLKARGYRWNNGEDGTPKCWSTSIPEETSEAELSFLRSCIYDRPVDIPVRRLTATDRFR